VPLCRDLTQRRGGRFTELLHHCVEHEGEEMPRFSVALSATPAQAFLSIVETNQFKNLTHLKLEMRCGARPRAPARPLGEKTLGED